MLICEPWNLHGKQPRGKKLCVCAQAEARVREAAEKALEAARAEVGALQGRAGRAGRRRRGALACMPLGTNVPSLARHGERSALASQACL